MTNAKRNIVYIGCCLLCTTIMLSAMGLNNTMFALLENMGGLQYYSLMAVLSGFGSSIMCLVGSSFGEMFGSRRVVLISTTAALACMVVMGLTGNLWVFIIARALLSFAIGTFTVLPYTICAKIYSQDKYTSRVGFLSAIMAIGSFLGSTIAGTMVDRDMVPLSIIYPGVIGVIGALLIFAFLPKESTSQPKLDGGGILCLSLFLAGISYSFTFISSKGIEDWTIITGLLITVVSAVLLYKVEKKDAPLIPFRLFKNRNFAALCIISAMLSLYQVPMFVYVPVTGQSLMGLSAAMTGLFTLPRTILSIIVPIVFAVWANRSTQNMRRGQLYASIFVTIPFVVFGILGENMPIWLPFLLLGLTGFSEGLKGLSTNPLVLRVVEPADISIGIALLNTVGTAFTTVGTAILTAIYNIQADTNLPGALTSAYFATAAFGVIAIMAAQFMLKPAE